LQTFWIYRRQQAKLAYRHIALADMVDFQRTLQMRSKVVSAIEMLIRG
jgi:hypothetical protein